MAFQMCEKLQRYTWPLKVEVTSNAPMNWFMAPLLASTGRLGTFAPLPASSARRTSVQYPLPTVNPAAGSPGKRSRQHSTRSRESMGKVDLAQQHLESRFVPQVLPVPPHIKV